MHQFDQLNNAAAWLAAFDGERPAADCGSSGTGNQATQIGMPAGTSRRMLNLLEAPADWSPVLARTEGCHVIFDGIVHNRAELRSRFADRLPSNSTDADLVAQSYRRWGEGALLQLRGSFALIIWDAEQDKLLCARDQLGLHPLFYADAGRTLLLSPSIDTLLGHPGVSKELNRAGLVEHLSWRWTKIGDTYFSHVNRIPPGHLLRINRNGRQVNRYWEPAPADRPIAWIPDNEAQERFDALLEQAVDRRVAPGVTGIFLSGGLDSVRIALAAADVCRRQGQAPPLALSVGFIGANHDDLALQRDIAADLNVPHVVSTLDEIVGGNGALAVALELSQRLPVPMQSLMDLAFMRLALEARQRGCKVILTGEGADDWLGVHPILTADLLRSLDLTGIYRLWRTHARSYPYRKWAHLRGLLWRWGARQLMANAWNRLAPMAPVRTLRHHLMAARAAATLPWAVPDTLLRAQVARRIEESYGAGQEIRQTDSFYRRELRRKLIDPRTCFRMEEAFLRGRRAGVSVQHPYWDVDLIQLLVGVRPHVQNRGGLSKALERSSVARRLPRLGFETRAKTSPMKFFQTVIAGEIFQAYRSMAGTWTLGELGVVDPGQIKVFFDNLIAADRPETWGHAWNVLGLEAWVRAHCS